MMQDPGNPWITWLLQLIASPPLISMLMLMMLIDIAAGVVVALKERKLSSKTGFVGMMKKSAMLLVVGMTAVIEATIHIAMPEGLRTQLNIPLAKFTAGFFLIQEAISVLENANHAGAPLPEFLTRGLADARDRLSNWGRNATSRKSADEPKPPSP